MSNMTTENDAAVPATAETPRTYRPKLRFFHPNAKGTGCAVEMNLHPAHDLVDGSIMVRVANQMTVGDRMAAIPTFPRFDWENPVCVKLDFSDLCKILQVFRGECESLENDQGLVHRSPSGMTRIVLRHLVDPVAGYSFEIYRTPPQGEEMRTHIFFRPWEALGLCEAIAGSMSVISFGIPVVIPHDTTAYKAAQKELCHARVA